jgi:hypothetical protein
LLISYYVEALAATPRAILVQAIHRQCAKKAAKFLFSIVSVEELLGRIVSTGKRSDLIRYVAASRHFTKHIRIRVVMRDWQL